MKLSVSLSAVLVLLPALVTAAASPLDGSHGGLYMPRHRARHFGRQRQGQFGGNRNGRNRGGNNGQNQNNQNNGGNNNNGAASSTSVATTAAATTSAATTSASAAATTTASVAANNGGNNGNNNNGNNNNGNNNNGNNNNGNNNNGNNNNNNGNTTTSVAQTASSTSSAAAATTAATDANNNGNNGNNNNNNNNGNNGNNNNNNDPNTSLTLLAELVATNLAQDGQATPVDGQVPSKTTTNNFINFCAGKTITNGAQVVGGSCNPIPMGDIIPQSKMPSCKFQFPENFGTVGANQAFTVQMRLNNLQAGTFTNAQKTYYMAPQFLNGNQVVIGHTHVVIQPMGAFDDGTILDPKTFAFFKGVNTGQVNGVVTADVTNGLPAGNYRMCSINTSANHTPCVAAVAQHGWLDDCTYFTAQ